MLLQAWGIYWSFKEFGKLLSRDGSWFVLAAVRSTVVAKIPGGISHLYKLLLHLFFGDLHSFSHGILLPLGEGGDPTVFTASLQILIADEDARRAIVHCKGHGGLMLCMECQNCIKPDSPLLKHSAWLRPSTCVVLSEFKPHTDKSVRAVLADLQAKAADFASGRLAKGAWEELQVHYGWNHQPDNFLLDSSLDVKIISALMHDWMHIYLVTGLLQYELFGLFLFLNAHKSLAGKVWPMASKFVGEFQWPRHLRSPSERVKPSTISEEGKHFRCSASEGLNLYPVLALFVVRVIAPLKILPKQVKSFLALCDVLDLLVTVITGKVDADLLHAAIALHLQLYLVHATKNYYLL